MFHDMVHDYTYGFTVIDVETGDEVDPMTIIAPTAVILQFHTFIIIVSLKF